MYFVRCFTDNKQYLLEATLIIVKRKKKKKQTPTLTQTYSEIHPGQQLPNLNSIWAESDLTAAPYRYKRMFMYSRLQYFAYT